MLIAMLVVVRYCIPPGGGDFVGDDYCEAEGKDRARIELPRGQLELVLALRKAAPGTPLIGVLIHGGAIALGPAAGALDAIVDAWQPGIEGATVIVEMVFGDFSPAGRTPTTW